MKLSKKTYLVISALFIVDFAYSLLNKRQTHELFFWQVNIWFYRIYRLAIALLFIRLYLEQKGEDSKNQ